MINYQFIYTVFIFISTHLKAHLHWQSLLLVSWGKHHPQQCRCLCNVHTYLGSLVSATGYRIVSLYLAKVRTKYI
jgi:hypothetical protein